MNSRTLAALAMGILTQQGCARAPDAPAGAEVAFTARASISASPALSSAAPQSAAPRADGPASAAREAPPAEAVDVAAYFSGQPRPDFPDKVKDWPNGGKPVDARY